MSTSRGSSRLAVELRRSRHGLIMLGALVAAALIAVVVLISGLKVRLPWQDSYTVRLAVADAKGVVAGKQQVRISGLAVGKVTGVENEGGHPVLTLKLDGRYAPLYRDARMQLRPKTPLEDLYVDVTSRGTARAGKLDDKAVLPVARSHVPVAIGRVLDTFQADTRVRLKRAIDGIGAGLADHGDDFKAALVELGPFLQAARRLTAVTAQRHTQTARLVHNFRLLTDELGARDHELRRLVTTAGQTFDVLGAHERQIQETIAALPPALARLQPAFATLRAAADEVDPALDRLQPAARALPGALASLRTFSADATPALGALRSTLPSLRALVTALRPTAAGLSRDFTLLRPQAPQFDRSTQKVVPCELAFQKFFTNTISLSKFYDTGGVIVRGQTVSGLDPNQRRLRSCAPAGAGG
jgi:phospholipid/cholesterol/gamma-HCH transport system substrate-binding protein